MTVPDVKLVLAWVGCNMIRMWPLLVEQPWGEDGLEESDELWGQQTLAPPHVGLWRNEVEEGGGGGGCPRWPKCSWCTVNGGGHADGCAWSLNDWRRSVRAYTDEPVTDDQVRKLLTVGMQAPSAGNQQPWHFVVLPRREYLDRLAGVFGVRQGGSGTCPLGIVVCADVGRKQHAGRWVQDCCGCDPEHPVGLPCPRLGRGVDRRRPGRRAGAGAARAPGLTCNSDAALCDRHRPAGDHPAPVDRSRPDRIHAEQR